MTTMTHTTPPVFVLDPNPLVRWPVTVRIPVDGGMADFRFDATIRVFAEEAYARVLPPETDADGNEIVRTAFGVLTDNAHYLRMHIADWHGVVSADQRPLPIDVLPEQILYGPYGMALSRGLWRAIHEVRYGLDPQQPGALEGNVEPSPGAGLNSASSAAELTK